MDENHDSGLIPKRRYKTFKYDWCLDIQWPSQGIDNRVRMRAKLERKEKESKTDIKCNNTQ